MPLRIGVVGVGHLGQHHARILASLPEAVLVGVADTKDGRAAEIGARYGVPGYAEASELLPLVDAVSIAVPTASHVEVALPFVERGIHILVEKPVAASVADADRLVEAAARRGIVLAAGHTERFNPAVAAALPLVANPRFIEVHRLGTFPDRSLDIDVIFDLMIHDLDLLLAAVGSDVVSIEAVGVNVLTPRTDIANARLRFASGCIANLTASRISRDRVRKARFFQHDSYVSIDFAAREVEVYRLVPDGGSPGGSRGAGAPAARPAIQGGRLDVAQDVPLQRGRRPLDGAAPREPGLAELIRDRRVHVRHQGQAEKAREGSGQVRRLFDRVHHVEAAGQHPPRRLGHEGDVEHQLRQRRARPYVADGEAQAAAVIEAGDRDRCALREGEQLDVVPGRHQRAHHGQHGQGGAAHLEERLGGEEQDAQAAGRSRGGRGPRAHAGRASSVSSGSQSSVTCSPRKRSASMAAMQPLPAAVTAWR
jgi:predicted dehydrogenase